MQQFVSIMEAFGKPLALLVVLLVLLLVVRPLVKLLTAAPKGKAPEGPLSKEEVDALAEELEASLIGRKPTLTDREKITRLAQSDPERAKDLIRSWLRE